MLVHIRTGVVPQPHCSYSNNSQLAPPPTNPTKSWESILSGSEGELLLLLIGLAWIAFGSAALREQARASGHILLAEVTVIIRRIQRGNSLRSNGLWTRFIWIHILCCEAGSVVRSVASWKGDSGIELSRLGSLCVSRYFVDVHFTFSINTELSTTPLL